MLDLNNIKKTAAHKNQMNEWHSMGHYSIEAIFVILGTAFYWFAVNWVATLCVTGIRNQIDVHAPIRFVLSVES